MRGMPGGSQYRCTGSLVLSNVCRAPNGGLASLNFSAAQGVMGACSGCCANGSDESQVFSLTPSGPLKSGSHRPDKSGIPPDIRPGFLDFSPAEFAADWANSTEEKNSAANIASTDTTMRFRNMKENLQQFPFRAYSPPHQIWPLHTLCNNHPNLLSFRAERGIPLSFHGPNRGEIPRSARNDKNKLSRGLRFNQPGPEAPGR